jgi:hypothetical protein
LVGGWNTGIFADASGLYVTGSNYGSGAFVSKLDSDGNEVWTQEFGLPSWGSGMDACADASGVYVTGYCNAYTGSDGFVTKFDTAGNEVWTEQFGSFGGRLIPFGIASDASGLYVAGWTDGCLPGQVSAGGPDAFVRKYDLGGNEVWTRQFGTSGDDEALGISVNGSGVVVTGQVEGAFPGQTSAGDFDAFARAYDTDGNEVWTQQLGWSCAELAWGVSAVGSGIYVCGYSGDTAADNPSEAVAFIAKLILNHPPVASADGPYSIMERQSLTLDASGSSDPDGDALTYSWDVNGDGTFGDAAGASPTLTWTQLQALGISAASPGVFNVAMKVDDGKGGVSTSPATTLTVIPPSVIQGMVWEDFNDDGQVNFGEKAIAGVSLELSGTDDRGNAVTLQAVTDSEGLYLFDDLRPGTYSIREVQPAGYSDGQDVLGTVNGTPVGTNATNDLLGDVLLIQPGSVGTNYNFGERPVVTGTVGKNQTASVGFWHNKHGQELIRSLNGSPDSTLLGHWLAVTFPNMYGAGAGANNLEGRTNAQVAEFYKQVFLNSERTNMAGGSPKLEARTLALAFAAYVTNQTLVEFRYMSANPQNPTVDPALKSIPESYGFMVSEYGVGACSFNVGASGEAFGVANDTEVVVMDILRATNDRTVNGVLYDLGGDGQWNDLEILLRRLANQVYGAINS